MIISKLLTKILYHWASSNWQTTKSNETFSTKLETSRKCTYLEAKRLLIHVILPVINSKMKSFWSLSCKMVFIRWGNHNLAVIWAKSKASYSAQSLGDSGYCENTSIRWPWRKSKSMMYPFIIGTVWHSKWRIVTFSLLLRTRRPWKTSWRYSSIVSTQLTESKAQLFPWENIFWTTVSEYPKWQKETYKRDKNWSST